MERPIEPAEAVRERIASGAAAGPWFRDALARVPPLERDAWVDRVLGLGELPDDGPELPRDGVPYLPCAADAVLSLVEHAPISERDVVVDVGAGLGRAAALLHLASGAPVIGIEIQPGLVRAARALASGLRLPRVSFVQGDAAELAGTMTSASVFFLYCPFAGARLAKVLADLEVLARARPLRVGCVDLPLPRCPWLAMERTLPGGLVIHRSTLA